ncbi:hypothetical protein [uncultured Leclercia sp.]|uniref:hypothetical protein n=1 Tax=uncultured Leclercia sp. TaxID=332959 RepID=UPI0025960D1A|nr:hypothetical protein [uncultured Leclercia sp.]
MRIDEVYRNVNIITDDNYFGYGLTVYLRENFFNLTPVMYADAINFIEYVGRENHCHCTLFIVCIKDPVLFSSVMKKIAGRYRTILFFFDVIIHSSACFRWGFTSKKNKVSSIGQLLKCVQRGLYKKPHEFLLNITRENILAYTCQGLSVVAIAEKMDLTTKYIYNEKRRVAEKYGFEHLNAKGLLLCRDLIEVAKTKQAQSL